MAGLFIFFLVVFTIRNSIKGYTFFGKTKRVHPFLKPLIQFPMIGSRYAVNVASVPNFNITDGDEWNFFLTKFVWQNIIFKLLRFFVFLTNHIFIFKQKIGIIKIAIANKKIKSFLCKNSKTIPNCVHNKTKNQRFA